ncbi:cytochrome P450 [Polyplosphaeria fusca]|uniref:Cytochrome P450 n=1 Tax=Polyplosphaeria fusca TaxID=682080 RepID=A0A9P4QX30_9PLEO|nr:cytochrome P450 [Polyplosphaeria fusca]
MGIFHAILRGILGWTHRETHDEREPPPVSSSFPYLGPSIGLLLRKSNYLVDLFTRYQQPIYTIRMPFTRLYVVNHPSLISASQRQINSIAFGPVGRDFGFLFSGLTKQSQEMIKRSGKFKNNGDYDKSSGNIGAIIHSYMRDPPTLETLTTAAVASLAKGIQGWNSAFNGFGMFEKIAHEMTLALTNAVYGPQNPFREEIVESSWRQFLPGISKLLLFPSITARSSLHARNRLIVAFESYFANGGHRQASAMVQSNHQLGLDFGLLPTELAKTEIPVCLALLSSGALAASWLLFHIYSDPAILTGCRRELLVLAETFYTEDGKLNRYLDATQIKSKCPILYSTLRETLRHHSTIISAKSVTEDVMLADQYLLKKGSILLIPGQVIHKSPVVWGVDADTFDHRRFVLPDMTQKKVGTSAFRPFGAGDTMCPGRHFSTDVILSLVAMIVLQFDLEPESGQWTAPTTKGADIWNTVPKPDNDIPVLAKPTQASDKVQLKVGWGALKKNVLNG